MKKGDNHLHGITKFYKTHLKLMEVYINNYKKAVEQFKKDMLKEKGIDTTTVCMNSIVEDMEF